MTAEQPQATAGRQWWPWARLLGAGAILAALVWRLGAQPFLDGLRMVDGVSLAAAGAIALVTTVCCAWRWSLVAGGLGVELPVRTAVSAYYRSQFMNTTLPGGVLGDVHRAVTHGRDVGDVGRGVRIVALERSGGQMVQLALAGLVLLLLQSPVRWAPLVVVAMVAAGASGSVLLGRRAGRGGTSVWARTADAVAGDVRSGLLRRSVWPGVLVASVAVVVGHATTFLIAARAAGSTASTVELLPLALLVLIAMSLPLNVAGWGLREGAAAWTFAAAGLGAAQGVSVAVVYGVLVLVASLPGAAVLVTEGLRHDGRARRPVGPPRHSAPVLLSRGSARA